MARLLFFSWLMIVFFHKDGSNINDTTNILKYASLLGREDHMVGFGGLNKGCSTDAMITLIKIEQMNHVLYATGVCYFKPMILSTGKATLYKDEDMYSFIEWWKY